MSFINDMLKQLESRKADLKVLPDIYLFKQNSRWLFWEKRQFIFFITSSVLIVTLVSSILYFKINKRNILTTKNNGHVIALKNNEKITSIAEYKPTIEPPIELTGISLQNVDNKIELTFLLSKATLYRINYQPENHMLNISFEHTSMHISTPTLNYADFGIKDIKPITDPDSAGFNLLLDDNVEIDKIDLVENQKSADLNIRFFKTQGKAIAQIKSPTPLAVLEDRYNAALRLAQNGDTATATMQLLQILTSNPDYDQARISVIALLLNEKKQTTAEKLLSEGLTSHPDFIPYLELKARLLIQQGHVDTALNLLLTQHPSIGEFPDYYALTAAIYQRKNNDIVAVKLYRDLISINPENGKWWFGLATSLDKLGDSQEATEAYVKAIGAGQLNQQAMNYINSRLQSLSRGA